MKAGGPGADRPGDARHLRAARQPARHPVGQDRAGGALLQVPAPHRLRRPGRPHRRHGPREGEVRRRGGRHHPRQAGGAGAQAGRLRPRQARLLGLAEDAPARRRLRPDPGHHRLPRPGGLGGRVLRVARRHPLALEAGAGALQGLHRHPQAERLPVAPHHRDRAARRAHRGPDPHRWRCTASPRRAWRPTGPTRRPGATARPSRSRPRTPPSSAGSASWSSSSARWTTRASSSRPSRSTSSPTRSSSSRPRGPSRPCRAGPRRSTSPSPSTPRSAPTASAPR